MLYFVPTKGNTITRERCVELGLGYAMGAGGVSFAAMQRGPEGQAGVVFSFTGANLSLAGSAKFERHALLDAEVWCAASGRAAKPEDCERDDAVAGHPVRLGDGQLWTIPVARNYTGATGLPMRMRFTASGWVPGEVYDEQHRELFAHACRAWDSIGPDSDSLTLDDECGIAAMAISTNYRLGPVEISALGLITTEVEGEIVGALCDLPLLRELKKKAEAAAPTSEPGVVAS